MGRRIGERRDGDDGGSVRDGVDSGARGKAKRRAKIDRDTRNNILGTQPSDEVGYGFHDIPGEISRIPSLNKEVAVKSNQVETKTKGDIQREEVIELKKELFILGLEMKTDDLDELRAQVEEAEGILKKELAKLGVTAINGDLDFATSRALYEYLLKEGSSEDAAWSKEDILAMIQQPEIQAAVKQLEKGAEEFAKILKTAPAETPRVEPVQGIVGVDSVPVEILTPERLATKLEAPVQGNNIGKLWRQSVDGRYSLEQRIGFYDQLLLVYRGKLEEHLEAGNGKSAMETRGTLVDIAEKKAALEREIMGQNSGQEQITESNRSVSPENSQVEPVQPAVGTVESKEPKHETETDRVFHEQSKKLEEIYKKFKPQVRELEEMLDADKVDLAVVKNKLEELAGIIKEVDELSKEGLPEDIDKDRGFIFDNAIWQMHGAFNNIKDRIEERLAQSAQTEASAGTLEVAEENLITEQEKKMDKILIEVREKVRHAFKESLLADGNTEEEAQQYIETQIAQKAILKKAQQVYENILGKLKKEKK